MEGFYLALGLTVVLPFAQWLAPTMPRLVAYTGMAGGILIVFAEFLDQSMKPPFSVVILFLIGALCMGGAAHLYWQFLRKAPDKTADERAKPDTQTAGSSFMRIAPGASVDGLTIKRGSIGGVGTGFDVGGTLSNAEIEDFNINKDGSGGRADIIGIERADSRPPEQRGPVHPSWPPKESSNPDGTITAVVPFTIDHGITTNLAVAIKGKNLIDFKIMRNHQVVATTASVTPDGFSLQTIKNASGGYQLEVKRKPGDEKMNVQFRVGG
jgi:hypothetical protein